MYVVFDDKVPQMRDFPIIKLSRRGNHVKFGKAFVYFCLFMLKSWFLQFSVILLFGTVACNRNPPSDEETITSWENRISQKDLLVKCQSFLKSVSDSGTINGRFLNQPDTLRTLLESKNWLDEFTKYLISEEVLDYPVFFAGKAALHGLEGIYYHSDILTRTTAALKSNRWDTLFPIPYDTLAEHVIYAADAFLGIYHDMNCGRINPDYHGSIDALPRRAAPGGYQMLRSDTIIEAITASFPKFYPYRQMQAEYERLAGFTPEMLGPQIKFTRTKPFRVGDSIGTAAVHLAKKLRLHGFLTLHDSFIAKKRLFDNDLALALSNFKLKHGLEPDFVMDKQTRDMLNITHAMMIKSLKVNLERWRWLGPATEKSRIWVNIAENKAYAWQEDTLELVMNVCSGKNRDETYYERLEKSKNDKDAVPPDNLETPLMKAQLRYLVANPTWHVPRNIMTKELLPAIQKDPAYLANHNYRLYNWKGEELNPFSINWNKVTRENWKYRIEQGEGEDNALGIVVLQFPNSYSIFMHDTPSKFAFKLENRHVSHGCVRMEKPVEMVEFLTSFNQPDNYDEMLIALGKEPVRDEEKIKKYQESMKDSMKALRLKPKANTYFKVGAAIPVYLVYFTSYLNDLGGFVYTTDGYQRDEKLLAALYKPERKSITPSVQNQTTTEFSP